jgi:CheY-like chemotaxis protein
VLVIDDEEVVRNTARATLTRYGYRVLLANNGREGVELFGQHAPEISLVLLDMMMPVMGGEEALEFIREIRPDIPVIASSGYSELTAKERFAGRSVSGFLQKPYSAQTLANRVKEVLEHRAAAG